MESKPKDDMEFNSGSDIDENDIQPHDEELLKIQKKKSMPRVTITEFVQEDDDDMKSPEDKKEAKEVLHVDVENVSNIVIQ